MHYASHVPMHVSATGGVQMHMTNLKRAYQLFITNDKWISGWVLRYLLKPTLLWCIN
jgi:hypothetical protein